MENKFEPHETTYEIVRQLENGTLVADKSVKVMLVMQNKIIMTCFSF